MVALDHLTYSVKKQLKTKARKLLNHKLGIEKTDTVIELQIKLTKLEYDTQWPQNISLTKDSLQKLTELKNQIPHKSSKPSRPQIPDLHNTTVNKGMLVFNTKKDLHIVLTWIDNFIGWPDNQVVSKEILRKILDYNSHQTLPHIEYNYSDSTKLYTDSDNTKLYNDSDGTELYDINEVTIGTKEYQVQKLDTVRSTKTKTHKAFLERKKIEQEIGIKNWTINYSLSSVLSLVAVYTLTLTKTCTSITDQATSKLITVIYVIRNIQPHTV